MAEQVRSGGQDCGAARSLVERSYQLREEERMRSKPPVETWHPDNLTRRLRGDYGGTVKRGSALSRHELPDEQRASYKAQSTDGKR